MKFSADFIILVFNRADLFPCNLVFFFNSNYDSKIIALKYWELGCFFGHSCWSVPGVRAVSFSDKHIDWHDLLHIPNSNLLSYTFSLFVFFSSKYLSFFYKLFLFFFNKILALSIKKEKYQMYSPSYSHILIIQIHDRDLEIMFTKQQHRIREKRRH